jgi:UDP-N-acetylglucosamine diphosphorylase/glucosamine-1-phosphate N-acetyltransferase
VNRLDDATALLLAAGKGTRMRSDLAKVLFPLEGRPLILHVVDAAGLAGFPRIIVVVGHQHEAVRAALAGRRVEFALQAEQLGTGHAVAQAAPLLAGTTGDLVVLAGDAPLVRAGTLRDLVARHRQTRAVVTVLTAMHPAPQGYGRIVRGKTGGITAIVEDRDLAPEQRGLREINSSIYAFRWPFLEAALPRLGTRNEQGEYYLTDAVEMAFAAGERVEGVVAEDYREIMGVNTPEHLEEARAALRVRP